MDWIELAVALRWPAVVLISSVVLLFTQRRAIGGLIDRTKRLGTKKLGLDAEPAAQQEINTDTERADLARSSFDSVLLQETRVLLRGAAEESGEPAEYLERVGATFFIGWTFERAYRSIWGSQLIALRVLNSLAAGTTLDQLRPIFDDPNRINRLPDDTFERWLGFLENQRFVVRDGEAVRITYRGRDFLKYLIDQGYPETKPL